MKKNILKLITLLLLFTIHHTAFAQKGSELLIQANRATLERNYVEAMRLYGQYIELNPEDFRGYFNRGTTAYNAHKYDVAVRISPKRSF